MKFENQMQGLKYCVDATRSIENSGLPPEVKVYELESLKTKLEGNEFDLSLGIKRIDQSIKKAKGER